MSRGISLAPCGLVIERIESGTDRLLLVARPISTTAACPSCSSISAHIHSQYQRALADLPSQVEIKVVSPQAERTQLGTSDDEQRGRVLDALLERPELMALRQRVSVRASLEPLTAAETRRYVRHRVSALPGGAHGSGP